MMTRSRRRALVAAVVLLAVVAGLLILRNTVRKPTTITALFPTATAIYAGDEVRVAGVRVGKIEAIEPQGTQTMMKLAVDKGIPVPADARAIIVAPNLVGARYVQLTPAYGADGNTGAPMMHDGDTIGLDRTAVPVEWDEIKTQLARLSQDLGPAVGSTSSSVGRFIDSAANALDGNGEKLRETVRQLSGLSRILAEGSGNITDIVSNLQLFVTALRDSHTQVVQFQNRLATVTSVLDGSRSDLDAALTDLSTAVVEVQRFVAGSRNQAVEQVERLTDVLGNVADNQMVLKNLLHVAPNAIGNAYNIYNPDTQASLGAFALHNFSNPLQVVCAAIGAVENATASETSRLCSQYLGPALRLINFNELPFPFNAYLGKSPSPWNLIYSEPQLAPGGGGPGSTVELPPEISAYTGLNGDVPPPPGWGGPPPTGRGSYVPNGLPADPQPALYPGAPVPPPVPHGPEPTTSSTLNDMLLPAEAAPHGGSIPPPPAPPLQPVAPSVSGG